MVEMEFDLRTEGHLGPMSLNTLYVDSYAEHFCIKT